MTDESQTEPGLVGYLLVLTIFFAIAAPALA